LADKQTETKREREVGPKGGRAEHLASNHGNIAFDIVKVSKCCYKARISCFFFLGKQVMLKRHAYPFACLFFLVGKTVLLPGMQILFSSE